MEENMKRNVHIYVAVRRLLRVPWTARRSNQSFPKEINPEYSLEGLMLKLQYSGYLMWRPDSLEKTLSLGRLRAKGEQRMRWLDSITNSMDMNLNNLWETVKDRGAWRASVPGVANLVTQQQQNVAVQQKLTQQCKTIVPQKIKNNSSWFMDI